MKKVIIQTELDLTDGPLAEDYTSALELEGECRIISVIPLQWSWFKFCMLIIPMVATLVPLLLLKYYKWFRVMCFYKEVSFAEATSLYIQATGSVDDIQNFIKQEKEERSDEKLFYFKNLKYKLVKGKPFPIYFDISDSFQTYCGKQNLNNGLSASQVLKQRAIFGKNEHLVETPWYHQYMFEVMTKPFFLLQYFICIIWILESIWIFAVIMLVFSFVTTTVNYILLWLSFQKIKAIAEKVVKVKVIRDGNEEEIDSDMLVPGDLFRPEEELHCDGVLVKGQTYVNEASLTGESVPIGKFPVNGQDYLKEGNRWLNQGSIVLEVRGHALARVVNVGYGTKRGRIIRKILTRVAKPPDFFKTALLFLTETLIVGFILYLATLPLLLRLNIVPEYIVYRLLDYLAWTFPPPLPIFFNLCYSFALGRLRSKGINGTQPQKTLQSAKLKTFCFDKTGTLTENAVQVYQVIRFDGQQSYSSITYGKQDPANQIIWKFFATCHTVKEIGGQFLGDQVDLRMFLFANYQMKVTEDASIKFVVQNNKGERLQVLRVNQFQSKFQSMSVLVKDCKNGKYYALLKGAPEKVERNSTLKVKEYENLVAKMSLGGYRTIGFGFKEIAPSDVNNYLTGPRELFQQNIRALGIVAFENKLKHDTRQAILQLIEANIEPKMITGDNIFIAVETGVRAGIIQKGTPVILIEGRKQHFIQGESRIFKGILVTRNQANQAIQTPIQLPENGEEFLNQKYPMAVDNDFITLNPEPFLPRKIKLFSRISPQNKALVVRRLKEQTANQYSSRSFRERFFGELPPKVGMCGDGANDLMAIRQADVGLGISDSDASYGASFSIVNMMDVNQIVRDSKAAQSNLIEMFQYFCTMSWIKLVGYTLLLSDGTSFNGLQTIYFNFISTIWLPILMGLSRPSKGMNPYSPCSNLMGLANHLVFWGNVIIPTAGLCASYFYYINTPDWVPNSRPIVTSAGYFPVNKSNSLLFIMIQVPFVWNSFFIYSSHPFKQRIWKNRWLTLLIIGNILTSIALFFLTAFMFKEFVILPVSIGYGLTALSIMFNFILLQWLFAIWIEKMELYKYQKLANRNLEIEAHQEPSNRVLNLDERSGQEGMANR